MGEVGEARKETKKGEESQAGNVPNKSKAGKNKAGEKGEKSEGKCRGRCARVHFNLQLTRCYLLPHLSVLPRLLLLRHHCGDAASGHT